MTTSCRLTIFEGPDGAGKTTAAKTYAAVTSARYVHFSAMSHVSSSLPRLFAEAMLPAVLGYQDVVLDRCWLSEPIYGAVLRGGQDRVGDISTAMLERLALRCDAQVVFCDPGDEALRASYLRRHEDELPKSADQIVQLAELYRSLHKRTELPWHLYDYTHEKVAGLIKRVDQPSLFPRLHQLDTASAGNLQARVLLVGEQFAERKNDDMWYQWPFASFGGNGCSRWLTKQLLDAKISESELLWVNADQPLNDLITDDRHVIALGNAAYSKLYATRRCGPKTHTVPHPQHWKRFKHGEPYPLIDLLHAIV